MERVGSTTVSALILTYNEEDNIERVLDKLRWLESVVVLDSYSTDATVEIVRRFSNTEVHFREFDTHSGQWNYGLSLIKSRWVLTLDADYVLTPDFIEETRGLIRPDADNGLTTAYFAKFKFLVFGKALRRNNTTPRPVLFRKERGSYYDDGHTQRLRIEGNSGNFRAYILHDDRKPLSRWLYNLNNYSIKETDKLLGSNCSDDNSLVLRIRKTKVFAPFLVFFYCLIVNGSFLDGWRGWHYTIQRTLVEMLFALRLIEEDNLKKEQ